MPYFEKKIISGRVIEIERYCASKNGRRIRAPKHRETPEEMQKVNERNAWKQLPRLINANFSTGDLFVTLTYAKAPSRTQAQKEIQKFLRRVRMLRKREGLPELKYIYSTEDSTRMHHHVIMSKLSMDAVTGLWPNGRVMISPLMPDEDCEYAKLARYIIKETAGTTKEEWPTSRRWISSRNLKKPEVKVREIARFNPLVAPKEAIGIAKGLKKYKNLRLVDFYNGSGMYGDYQYIRMIRQETG